MLESTHSYLSIREQCLLFGINRSGYYYKPKPVNKEAFAMMMMVDEIYTKHPYFGSRQMSNYLRLNGYDVGRSKIRSIYEQLGLQATCLLVHIQVNRIQSIRFTLICSVMLI